MELRMIPKALAALSLAASLSVTACQQSPASREPATDTTAHATSAQDSQDTTGCNVVPRLLHQDPVRLVREYLERDASGQFLRPSEWLAGAIACPGRRPGWDEATLIGNYRMKSIQPGEDTMKAAVESTILRTISQDSHGPILVGTRAGERVAVDTFVVVRTPFGWRIAAPVRRPFLYAQGALAHLQFRDADRALLDSLAGRGG